MKRRWESLEATKLLENPEGGSCRWLRERRYVREECDMRTGRINAY
jgi:hypothetical protein